MKSLLGLVISAFSPERLGISEDPEKQSGTGDCTVSVCHSVTQGFASYGTISQLYNFRVTSVFTLLHSERPKLYTILAFLSAIGLNWVWCPNN